MKGQPAVSEPRDPDHRFFAAQALGEQVMVKPRPIEDSNRLIKRVREAPSRL